MNKIYKAIWNATLGTWVAVSEIAKGKTKSSNTTLAVGSVALTLMVTFSPTVDAAWTSGNAVASGSGAIGLSSSDAYAANVSGTYAIGIGNAVVASGNSAVAMGSGANASGTGALALGNDSRATAANATAVGAGNNDGVNYASATATGASAFGYNSKASGVNSLSLGSGTAAQSGYSTAIGYGSVANSQGASNQAALAIGSSATANSTGGAIAVGVSSNSLGINTVAIGTQSRAAKDKAISIGSDTNASELYSVALGSGAQAQAQSSIAIGGNSSYGGLAGRTSATAIGAVALGAGAQSTIANSVALGATSITSASVNSTNQVINGKSYTATGAADASVISVGSSSLKRQIQNVAAGQITATSTDAVNGSQLYNTNQELANVAANTAAALGGGATANTVAGGITAPSYAVLTDPNTGATTNVNNVGTAITSLNAAIQKPITFTGDTGTTSNKLNSSFAIVGDTNITTAVTANQAQIKLNPDITLKSVTTTDGAGNSTVVNATGTKITDTTGNTNTSTSTTNVLKQGTNTLTTSATGTTVTNGTNTTTLNASGVSITNGPSMTTSGVNAGNKVISNVLAGSALTDAVNVSQLNVVKANADNLGTTTATALGGGASYNAATGALTAPTYSVVSNPNGVASNVTGVAAALNSLNTAVTTPLYFKDAASGTSSNKLGSTFAIVGDTNITTAVTANQAQIKLNPDITLKSVTTTDGAGNSTVVNATGTKITDSTGNTNTSTSTTNVLKQGSNTLTTSATGTTVTDGTNTTTLNASGVSITNGPSITTSGVNAGNKVISNVLAGSALTDAVNVSQLNAAKANADNLGTTTATALGGGASYNAATGALTAPTYSVVSNPNGVASNVTGVAAALNSLNTAVTTPLYFKDAASGTSSNKLGSTFAIVGDTNITTAVTANQAQIKLNPDITLKSVTTTDGAGNSSVLNSTGLVVSNAEGSTTVSADGISIANGPSLNANGLDLADAPNGITNLANGVVSATSKDGINGSQLWEAQSNLATLLGGKSQISNSDGTVTTSDIGGTGKDNINDAVQYVKNQAFNPLTFTGDSGSSTNQLGSTLAITGDDNITTTASQGKVAVSLNKAITVDSINAGGVTVDNKGINANGQTITGVKDGAAASDAVNKGQLDAANAGGQAATDALGNSLAQNLGGDAKYENGVVTAPNYQITNLDGSNSTAATVGDAISSLNTAVTTPLTFTGDSGSSTNKLGTTLAITGDDNITTTASQGKVAVSLNKAITVDSINAGGVTVDNKGINANGQTITGVKDGAAASDAVNKGQLDAANAGGQAATDALGNSLAQNLGGDAKYENGVVTAPNYQITNLDGSNSTAATVGDAISSLNTAVTTPLTFTGDSGSSTNKLGTTLAITGDDNITTTASQGKVAVSLNKAITVDSINAGGVTVDNKGINANGQTITGVKDGAAASDAVNKGQLDAANAGGQAATDALGNSLAQNLGGDAKYENGVVTAPNYQITNLDGSNSTAATVGDAISSLNTAVTTPLTFTGDSGSSTNKLGTTLAITGDDNITTTASQGKVAVSLNKAITVDSINAGGVTVDNKGINANGQTITGVKDGAAASDAVNKGQLDAANAGGQAATDALGNSLAQNLGGDAKYENGVVTAPNYQITNLDGSNSTAATVGDAISSLNTAVTTPLTFTGDSGSSTNKLGTTLAITGDDNITTTASQGKVAVSLNKAITVDSINAGGVTVDNKGINANGQTITGVKDGAAASDAVNKGQLDAANAGGQAATDALGNSLAQNLGGDAKYENGVVTAPNYQITNLDGSNSTAATVGDAISSLNTAVTTPLTFTGDSGSSTNKLGTTLAITGDDNITTTASQGKVAVSLNKAITVDSINAGGVTVDNKGINANGQTITGVKDGAAASDAVNKGQLDAANAGGQAATDALGNSLAQNLGGDAKYENGVVTAPNYQITNLDGSNSTAATVGDAISSLNTAVTTPLTFTGDSGSSTNKLGTTLAITGDDNITTTASQGKVAVSLNKAITVDSINAGGVTVDNKGINANGQTITGVKDGAAASDAVNKGQLDAANAGGQAATDALGNSLAQNLGGDAKYENGVVTAPNYQITNLDGSNSTAATVGDAISSLNTAVTTPLTFTGDSGSSTNKLGTTLAITGDDNITTTASQGKVAVSLNKAITVDSINAGGVTVDNKGINANGQTITGVKDGAAASDAVNKGQLDAANAGGQAATDALGNSLAQNLGGDAKYENGVVTAPNYQITNLDGSNSTAATVGDAISSLNTAVTTPLTFTGDSGSSTNKLGTALAITGDDNITTTASQGKVAVSLNKAITVDSINAGGVTVDNKGINANGQTITGVKDGAAASDAVNKGQLDAANAGGQAATDALGNSLAQNLGGSSTYKDGVVTAPNYQITNLDGSNSTAATVGDAISSLNTAVTTPLTFTGDSGSSTNKLGTTLAITGDNNITTTASQGKVAVTLNKDLTGLNSVQTVDANDPNKVSTLTAGGTTVTDGTNTTVYGSNGLDINNGAVTLGKDGLNAGGVTVGKDGINANDKTISNVGDAVNGKDATNLQQVQDIVAKSGEGSQAATDALGNSLAQNLGGSSTYKDGVVTTPNYQITNLDGSNSTAATVGDAISSLNTAVTTPLTFTGDSGSSTNKLGTTLAITGDDNITTTASQGKVAVTLNKDLTGLNSVQTVDANDPNKVSTLTAGGTTVTDGTNTTVYGSNGLDINNGAVTLGKDGLNAGGVTVGKDGINANDKTISNVGDAVNGKDATNLQQVQDIVAKSGEGSQAATDALGNSLAQNLGGSSTYKDGVVTAPNYQITNLDGSNSTAATVGDAISSLNTAVTTPLTFTGDSGSSTNKLGTTLAITGDDNITTTASQGKVAVSLNKAITVDSINAGGVTVDNKGINANGQTITGVKDGAAASDAVNKGQLDAANAGGQAATDALGNSLAQNLGGDAKYENGVVTAPNYQITNLDGSNSTAATVGDAISSLNTAVTTPLTFTGDSGSSTNKLGTTLAITGDNNITTTASQGKVAVTLNKDLTGLNSVQTVDANDPNKVSTLTAGGTTVTDGANTTVYGSNGLDINNGAVTLGKDGLNAGGVTVGKDGINANDKTISNVGDAVNGKDATNLQQVQDIVAKSGEGSQAATDALGNSLAQNLGGSSTYKDGVVTAPNYQITNLDGSNSTAATVGDAISSLNTAVTTPLNFSGDKGTGSSNKLGSTLAVVGDSNITTTATQDQIAVTLNKDLTIDSITAGNSKLDNSGLTVKNGNNTALYGADGINLNNGAVTVNKDGLTIAGGPSVTSAGINAGNKTISNVADAVNANDAVNKAQLDAASKAQDGKSATLGESTATALGGGSKYDSATGSITAPSYNLTNLDGSQTTASSVGDAISSLNAAVTTPLTFTGDKGTGSSNKLGTNLAIIGDQNISTTATQGQLQASLNSDLKGLTSVQTVDKNDPNKVSTLTANGTQVTDGTNSTNYGANGVNINNGAVMLNNNGLTIAGGPSVTKLGINAGGQTISNVGNAVNATDAINKGQLDNAIAGVTKDLGNLNETAVQYDKNADGSTDKNNITLAGGTDGTGIHNVADGKVEAGSKDAVNGSQLAGVRDDLQGQITQNSNDITNIKNELNNGSVGLVQQADKDATVTVAKGTGGNKVDVSGTAGDRVITGVANGAVTSGSKDAVNGSQLNATNQAVVQYLGGGAGYDNITGSFTAPTYNVSDKSYNNVGDAVTALDNADKALNSKIDNVSSRLEDAFRSTNSRIDSVEKKANAGIAAALSLESAPYVPGKYTYAAGAAYHGGESAVGVTLRKTADSGKWSLTGGAATDSQGSPSFRIGVSGVID